MIDPIQTALGPSGDCPTLEALAAAPAGSDIERHLAACAHCRTELALLREFETAEVRPHELASVEWIASRLRRDAAAATGRTRPETVWNRLRAWVAFPFAPGPQRAFAAVAALLLVVAAGLYLRPAAETRHPAAVDGTVWRSGRFAAVSPAGDVAEAPAEFRWEPVPDAAAYRIQLMEVDRTVIWSGDSAQTAIAIPQAVRAQLQPARAFLWQVTAKNQAGQPVASTDLQTFHVLITNR